MKWQIYEMLKGNRELDTQILEKSNNTGFTRCNHRVCYVL